MTHDVMPTGSTPDRETKKTTPNITQPLDGSTLPREFDSSLDSNKNPQLGKVENLEGDNQMDPAVLAQIKALLAQQGLDVVGRNPPAPATETPHWDRPEEVPGEESERTPFWTRRRKIGGAVIAGVSLLTAGVIAGARAFGGDSAVATPQTLPSASAPVTPGPQPSSVETSTPTPSASETEVAPTPSTVKPVGKDAKTGQTYLSETEGSDLNALKLSTRQKAVDWGNLLTIIDPDQGTLYNSSNPRDSEASVFNQKDNRELYESNPMYIAYNNSEKNAETSVEEYLDDASGQDLLDCYISAKAVVMGQLANPSDPSDNTLNVPLAENMLNGIFYDPNSKAAKAMRAELQTSGQAKFFNGDDRLSPDSTSKRVLTHDFGKGQVPYIAVNYSDQDGDHYLIFTAVKTEFEGNDVIDPKTEKEYTIIKPLVVAAGDGTVDLTGHLNNL